MQKDFPEKTLSGSKPVAPQSDAERPAKTHKLLYTKRHLHILCIFPVVIFVAGLLLFYVFLPQSLGTTIGIYDWLSSSPESIMENIRNSQNTPPPFLYVIFWKGIAYVLSAMLIASLYFIGRELQRKGYPDAPNAVLKGKEAANLMTQIAGELKILKAGLGPEAERVLALAKRLDENLRIQGDFGYGNADVISCENQIAHQLFSMQDAVKLLAHSQKSSQYLDAMEPSLQKLNLLLKQRTELSRK